MLDASRLNKPHVEQLTGDGPLVVIAPGAAHPNKQWGLERFAELARRLHREKGCRILWAVATSADVVTGLDESFPPGAYAELVGLPLEDLAAVVAQAQLTLANDSGVGHLSSALGTPVIAVFGATHPALGFAPRGLRDRVVEVDEPCRPCSLHGKKDCFRDQRYCFDRIDPDMVYDHAKDILDLQANSHPALFVDRDGTVIVDKNFLADPDGVELIPGAAQALAKAQSAGYSPVILSNQSGVARGLMSIDDVERVNARVQDLLLAQGVEVAGFYYSPFHKDGSVTEFARSSDTRKPGPGMAEQAALQLDLDLRGSVVIGDKADDVNLGRVLGCQSYLVLTGHGPEHEKAVAALPGDQKRIHNDLPTAVEHMLRERL